MATIYDGFLADIYDYCPYFRDRGNMADFYLSELDINYPTVLELGTATGSITIPLAEAGYSVDTVDYAKDMQVIAQNKTMACKQDVSKRINFVLEDVSKFLPTKEYDAILIPDSLLTIFLKESERRKVLKMCYDALREGGILLLDVFEPMGKIIDRRIYTEMSRFRNKAKEIYIVTVSHKIDDKEQLHSCIYNYKKWPNKERLNEGVDIRIVYRYLYPDEVKKILMEMGFCEVKITGIFDGNINFVAARKSFNRKVNSK